MPVAKIPRNKELDVAIKLSPLTHDQLCRALEINRTTLYKILVGTHKPRQKLLIELCKILNAESPEKLGLNV